MQALSADTHPLATPLVIIRLLNPQWCPVSESWCVQKLSALSRHLKGVNLGASILFGALGERSFEHFICTKIFFTYPEAN